MKVSAKFDYILKVIYNEMVKGFKIRFLNMNFKNHNKGHT
jgi:hypothetical protein